MEAAEHLLHKKSSKGSNLAEIVGYLSGWYKFMNIPLKSPELEWKAGDHSPKSKAPSSMIRKKERFAIESARVNKTAKICPRFV